MIDGRIIGRLIEQLRAGTPEEARSALKRLESRDPEMTKGLLELLEQPDSGLQMMVVNHIVRSGWPAIPAVMERLKDHRPKIRGFAVFILGRMGVSSAIPELLDALHDEDEKVRLAASLSLGQVCSPVNIPALVEKLCDDGCFEKAAYAIDTMVDISFTAERVEQIGLALQEGLRRLGKPPRRVGRKVAQLRRKAAKKQKQLAVMGGVMLSGEMPKPPKTPGDGPQGKILKLRR